VLVLLAVALFLAAVLQAGLLRDWMRPTVTLRVLLPEQGGAGLAVGGEMEVLGAQAGTVRRIVVDPSQRMYAEVQVDEQSKVFIRRDSAAVIRKRFGVAGAAYLDVTRGTGPELGWDFAVIEATTERAPTETVSVILDELRDKIFPILDDLQRGARAMADTMERLERGEGAVGRLLSDDTLARQAEGAAADARAAAAGVKRIMEEARAAVADLRGLVATISAPDGVPAMLRRTDQTLASLQRVSGDLARAAPTLPQTARNVQQGTSNLPALMNQAQQTMRELERLSTQLRGMWLLGGSGPQAPEPSRPGADRVRP
jgi:phospholipid/cholesterol/gamma-HCH transport system substrate-binding protein